MNIVIIGNPRKSGDKIKTLATELSEAGINVRYPAENSLDSTEDIKETYERIDWSDFVIAVPVEDITFDYSTTSSLAYAKHTKKPVLISYW